MQVIAGGRNLTSMKVLADIDRGSDGIIRLTQLDFSIENFEKIENELSEIRKKQSQNLDDMEKILNRGEINGEHTQESARKSVIAARPFLDKGTALRKEEKRLKKALNKKNIKYREAYIKKADRTETQIKKCDIEKEALLKDNLEPKVYDRYRELEKTLDSLHLDLSEYNCKAHGPWCF